MRRPIALLCRLAALLLLLVFAYGLATAQTGSPTSVSIHDIMVASKTTADTQYFLPDSPYLYSHYAQPVSVSGIVVGVMSGGDYPGTVYISESSSNWDSFVATAEGMPVFAVAALNPACAVVGNTITVVGNVVESTAIVPADVTAANTPGTGLQPTSCAVTSTGGTMTQAIGLGNTLSSFGGALEYTGMTTTATFYAVAPTTGTLTEKSETTTSTGQFWATLSSNTATNNHLFRSPGIAADETDPSTTAATWAGNPQRILIDTTTFGGSPVDITVGQSISCAVGANITVGATKGIGLIDYTLGYARLLIFPTSVCTVGGTVATTTSAQADSTHFHVGTLDLNRFYSATPAPGAVTITPAAYQTRLAKAALAIVNSLGKPDILSLQEVQDDQTLADLASAVNTLGSVSYIPYLTQGNDPNSLNLGFLVNSATVVTDSVTQVESGSTYGSGSTLWERPPLVLKAEFVRAGKNYPVTVLNVHLTPRDNIGDATLGPNVRAHRAAQAVDLSSLVQSYQSAGANVIVAGNLNAFEFSDGYVDVTGIVDGSPATAVVLPEPTATTAALTDFATSVPTTSRYNFIERGDAVIYEHILASATVPDSTTASASLASYATTIAQPHFTADFSAVSGNSSNTPAGLTPHDGFVVAFLIPPVPTTASISSTALNFGSVYLGASATQTVTITNTTTFASTINVSNLVISGSNPADFAQTSDCTSLTQGQSCTITLTFAPTAVGTRTATLTVADSSTSNPTLTASLTGNGVSALTLTPASLNFGNIDLGATSAAQTLTLSNNTAASIPLAGLAISGDYADTTSCTATLAADSSCTFAIRFTPTATGVRTGTLTVNGLTSTLTGNGVDFTLTVAPTSGSTIAGYSVTPTLTLTPVGGFNASITMSCTTTAAGSTCAPASSFLTLSTATSTAAPITTTSQYTVVGYGGFTTQNHPLRTLLWIASTVVLFLATRRRRSLPRLASALALTLICIFANGCSGMLPSKNATPTLPGTYTYTFSATDGTLTHTATYTLTVTAK